MTDSNFSPANKPRILVVEDEVVIAMDIQLQLKGLGYLPVGHATRGAQAIEMAAALKPDLVLMDIQLAGDMDGIAAAQTIRTQYGLPVVFVTAFAAEETLARAKLSEPYGYILKPFSNREMHTVIEMALYKHQADASLKLSVESLNRAFEHTQAILDNIVDAVITIDEQGLMESFNQAASTVFGYTADEAVGRNVSMLMPAPHGDLYDGFIHHFRPAGEARMIGEPRELQGLHQDGHLFPMKLTLTRLAHAGRTTFIGMVHDLTLSRQREDEIRRLAYYDPLTALPNRRLLLDHLKHATSASARTGQAGAVMFLDLDHFKQINDSLGHTVGDDVLQRVAKRLQASVGDGHLVARVGGDEFVLVLEALGDVGQESAKQTEALASKILSELGQPYALHDRSIVCTPSLGIAMFEQGNDDIEELLKKADAGMHQAKAAGRNKVRFFDPVMQAAAATRKALEAALRRGLEKEEFLLYFQIQIGSDGLPTGAEALVRWNRESGGMVSPAQFIPLAEESGLILPLGQWVLETACTQLLAWGNDPQTAHWSMAVNVSALQFLQADFVAHVEHALQKTGANPRLLKLELTESMLVGDIEAIISKMTALMVRGVRFSLDDFGTGYSSLTYLKRLPLAQLKIDQSFVRDLLTDPNDAVIAGTIVSLGHSLGLKVIAEGVETQGQRDFLAQMGCDAFQGYYFGHPVPASELI